MIEQTIDLLSHELEMAERQLHLAMSIVAPNPLVDPGKMYKLASQLRVDREFDPRKDFFGHNWYHSEHDGRWAGRSPISTIYIKQLPPGDYKISFRFQKFIVESFMHDMRIHLNAVPLNLKIRGLPSRTLLQRFTKTSPQPAYPVTYDAIVRIEDRNEDNVDILSFVFPFAEQPKAKDKRKLTARLSGIALTRV